ncbi:winged helix-turn-helix domain-containing protein [Vibrio parahaemolyticus]|nr:winged helix-turn-helix domain-containing protein [Vibrio parahaemolyticus]EJG0739849.1 winged helix-turn-helix domain-containing protein [Vibrio parahaemolyticus]EJG0918406.1 winged helix-turn-helix domain-containing protein [Vibrio parahaemolyticus]
MKNNTIWNLYPLAREQLVNTNTLKATKLKSTECRALQLLVKNQGKVVTKKDFFNKVWEDRIVSNNSLTQCIAQLRLALNDNGKDQKFIKTIPSQGYMIFENVVKITESETTITETSTLATSSTNSENEIIKTSKTNYNYTLQAKVWCIILFTTLFIYQTLDSAYRLSFSYGVTFDHWLTNHQKSKTFHFVKTPATENLHKYLSANSKHISDTPITNLFISKGIKNYYLSCIYISESTGEKRVNNITFPLRESFYFIGVTLDEVCR